MIIITATLSFATREDRDRAVVATADIQRATRDEEEACLAYCFAPDPVEPTHIQVYELWTDPDGLARHFEHHTYAAMVRALGSCGILHSDNRLWHAEDRGPVYGPDRAFRRDAVADS